MSGSGYLRWLEATAGYAWVIPRLALASSSTPDPRQVEILDHFCRALWPDRLDWQIRDRRDPVTTKSAQLPLITWDRCLLIRAPHGSGQDDLAYVLGRTAG